MLPANPAPPRMETLGLSAWYGPAPALRGISVRFAPTPVHALIGPAGCGKSTFLRLLNRLHEEMPGGRTAGGVFLDGEDVYSPKVDLKKLRRQVGMVFQRPTVFPTMSIFENVASGLRLKEGMNGKALAERVTNVLTVAGLWEEVKERLHGSALVLSAGQQQRLCIARTIATAPEVVLLDEPTASLDPQGAQRIEELLFRLKQKFTIIVVTHNLQQAARVSDTTSFFFLGELVETGPTRQLFKAPRESRTEAYITGRMG